MLENNYKYLKVVAQRVTIRKGIELADDLISETYLNLYEKETAYPKENGEFVKFFSKCMKNYFVWPNSSFNKLHCPKENVSIDFQFFGRNGGWRDRQLYTAIEEVSDRYDESIEDECALKEMEIQAEETDDFTKELISISSGLGKIKALKYTELLEFKQSLAPHEGILFELYFEKDLSTRDIAKMYSDEIHKMSYMSVNTMVNVIKSKIKEYQWKY